MARRGRAIYINRRRQTRFPPRGSLLSTDVIYQTYTPSPIHAPHEQDPTTLTTAEVRRMADEECQHARAEGRMLNSGRALGHAASHSSVPSLSQHNPPPINLPANNLLNPSQSMHGVQTGNDFGGTQTPSSSSAAPRQHSTPTPRKQTSSTNQQHQTSLTPRSSPNMASTNDTSPMPNPTTPVHHGYAHELKRSLSSHRNTSSARKRAPEHDPENYEIKRMRVEEAMTWADIARLLNDRRIANGQTPSLTEAAVYGRFVRNGPRIAAAQGEDFNPSDYMKLKNFKPMPETEVPPGMEVQEKFSAGQDAFLVESYHEVQQGFWQAVADRLQDKSGKKFTADQCAKRYQFL